MENREQQILSEIISMAASIREQLEALENKLIQLQTGAGTEEETGEPIDLDIDDIVSPEPSDDLPFYDLPSSEPVSVHLVDDLPESVSVESVDDLPEPESEPEPEQPSDDLPEFIEPEVEAVSEPEVVSEPEPEDILRLEEETVPVKTRTVMLDRMTARQSWRTDMPGAPVKDVRSAIALNDRILFINVLFNEDPMSFQNAVMKVNSMDTLDQVVEWLVMEHPEWDFDSEIVYRFMMAVRRRVK